MFWTGALLGPLQTQDGRCSWRLQGLLFSHSVMSDSVTPMDYNIPGFPVLYCLLAFAQTHVHWVSDAIQPFHPLLSPSLPALNLPQHQGLFQWVGSSHQVARISGLQFFSVVYFHFHVLLLSLLSVGVKSKKWWPGSFVCVWWTVDKLCLLSFILLHVAVQLSWPHLLKRRSFLRSFYILVSYVVDRLMVHGFISGLYYIDLYVCFHDGTILLWLL